MVQTLRMQVKEKKAQLFREKAMSKFGHSKGAISKALNEALDAWLSRFEGKKKFVSARELTGIISDLKDSSLQAQKKAVKWFGESD